MKEKIEDVFEALKNLEMPPTPKNVSIMNGVYNSLRIIFNELEENENGRTENGTAADLG